MSDLTGDRAVLTVFRSRLRPDAGADYGDWAERMLEIAQRLPGFVDFKIFRADDGERVSVITFESLEAQRAWGEHPDHRAAQRMGRERFYESYDIQVAEVVRQSHFPP